MIHSSFLVDVQSQDFTKKNEEKSWKFSCTGRGVCLKLFSTNNTQESCDINKHSLSLLKLMIYINMEQKIAQQVKVSYGEEIRRLSFTGNSFKMLVEEIKKLFSLKEESPIVVKYLDEDKDYITSKYLTFHVKIF